MKDDKYKENASKEEEKKEEEQHKERQRRRDELKFEKASELNENKKIREHIKIDDER